MRRLDGGRIVVWLCLVYGLSLTGCASIIHGTRQDVLITSTPPDAKVAIFRRIASASASSTEAEAAAPDGRPSRVLYTQTYTPGTVSLERDNRYAVIFEKEGYGREEVALDPVVNGWVFGNIFFGGLIGLTIDFINGAAYHLSPTPIAVALAPATTAETPEGPSAQIIPQPRAPDNVPAVDTQPLIPALPATPVEPPLVAIAPPPAPAVALPTVQVPPPAPAVALPTVQVQLLYYVVPLFSAPDAHAERLGRVHHSVALTLLETRGKWLYIQAPSGQRGWILQEWIQQ